MANRLSDLADQVQSFFRSRRSGEANYPYLPGSAGSGPSAGGPIEAADLWTADPDAPVALSTLGDPDLARSLAERGIAGLNTAGATATENIGVEKLIRREPYVQDGTT